MRFAPTVAVCLLFLSIAEARDLKGIEYARPGGVRLRMDAHIPDGPGPFPSAILVHGGAWISGTRRFNVRPLLGPLNRAGFAWFSISYRLARKAPLHGSMIDPSKIGDAIEDVQNAVEFVRNHADEYRLDSHRISLIGESAGAQLASMAAIRGANVNAVVSFYGPSDLVSLAKPSGIFREAAAKFTWGGAARSDLLELSPINAVRAGMPPFLFIHGTADPVVPFEQSGRMCDAMHLAGNSCEVFAVDRGLHGMHLWEAFRQTAYKTKLIDWLLSR